MGHIARQFADVIGHMVLVCAEEPQVAGVGPVEEIRAYIGADSLAYLSLEGLKLACGDGEKTTYCNACYTGKYPTHWVDVDEIQPAAVKG